MDEPKNTNVKRDETIYMKCPKKTNLETKSILAAEGGIRDKL